MPSRQFRQQIAELTAQLAGRELNADLQTWLNQEHGVDSPSYQQLKQSCEQGVAEGWLCNREGGGIRYGRIFKPADDLAGFSVDVVDMQDIVGPHHRHPNGEIDLIMPLEGEALFDQQAAGWLVYPAGSAHSPTVTQGRALVLYLLPQGSIEFTRSA
ncbi:DUF4863 family protein [Thiothrix eikelboomii]|uniref:4-hydroxylaminobenzoate lyase n=1 Tax=Thiothrix eikelboomii TaxID=92487 RepID=UPI003BB102C7